MRRCRLVELRSRAHKASLALVALERQGFSQTVVSGIETTKVSYATSILLTRDRHALWHAANGMACSAG